MKKIFAMTLCLILLLSIAVSVEAEAANVLYDCWSVDDSSVYCFAAPGEGTDVSVTAAGVPVTGTSMTTVEQANLPVTYICMIDQSTAYSLRQKEQQRQGVNALREKLRPQDKLVVVGMNTNTTFGGVLTQSQQWDAAIAETLVHTSFTTNLYHDLITMVSKVSNSEEYSGMRCVVMFTDGINDNRLPDTINQAKEALNTFRFSLHTYLVLDPNPSGYALQNASWMQQLSELTPGGVCVAPNRDNSTPSDGIDKIVAQVLSTPVIRMDAAQLDRSAETVELAVSLGGNTGTISIPTSQLPDLPPVTEPTTTVPETTVPEITVPEITVPTQAQWVVSTEPSAAPQPQQSNTTFYLLIGGGIAAIVLVVLVVILLSRRGREEEEEDYPVDEDLVFMDSEDAQDAVNSNSDINSIDLTGLELKSDFSSPFSEGGDDIFFSVPQKSPEEAPILESGCTVQLVPEDHPEDTVEFFLQTNTGITLGRSSRADVVLNEVDTALSGVHMEFQWDSRALHMRDRNSTNGTRVNGLPVKPDSWVRLENGSFIEAGSTRYQVYAKKK